MENLKQALDIISKGNLEGNISDEMMEKACASYKINSDDFIDSYEYDISVSKSLFDHINGIESNNDELLKAIIPGQTKTVDGIVYIYTKTPNAKTDYDWRVFKKVGKKIGRQVTNAKAISDKEDYVNEIFPKDISDVTVVKRLGGSTGAQLVKDSKGNEFVMKKGSNTSNEHVKSEYLTGQLYNLLGLKVPDYELYTDSKGNVTMLTKFIPLTHMPSAADYDKMSEGFVVDAFLANWDVYKNDNCLIDSAGRVIRVDNGGALNYRAQGGTKTYGADVNEIASLRKYNPTVLANLKDSDIIKQIEEVLKKKDDVIEFINQNPNLSSTVFRKRFESLERIKNRLIKKSRPRVQKPESHAELSEEKLDEIWENSSKQLSNSDELGWEILGDICRERGFDGKPKIVDDAEYWKNAPKAKYQMVRGLCSNGSNTGHDFAEDFKNGENCFYGSYGVYGAGIYFAINDDKKGKFRKKSNYKKSDSYSTAQGYAGGKGCGEIIECYLADDAKVVDWDFIEQEHRKGKEDYVDKDEYNKKSAEIDSMESDLFLKQTTLDDLKTNTESQIKKDLHWDENVLKDFQLYPDSIDWGKKDNEGNPDYPSFDNYVKGKMFDWVKNNGGTVREKSKGSDVFVFKMPNSNEPLMISKYQWDGEGAIKQKDSASEAYSYPERIFNSWLMKNHYQVIENKVKEGIDDLSDKIDALENEIKDIKDNLNATITYVNNMAKVTVTGGGGIYDAIASEGQSYVHGVYAALKGYDAMIKRFGPNQCSYLMVFNRNKVIVKK